MKRRLLGYLLLVAFTGCALVVRPDVSGPSNKPDENRPTGPTASISTIDTNKVALGVASPYWDKVRAGGPIVVGVTRNYPPFGVPSKQGGFVGLDPSLARHLGATLGVPVRLVGVTSAEIPDLLKEGRIDFAIAGMTRTAFRAAQINFSSPYLTVSQGALIERRYVEGSRGTDEERRRNSFESYLDLAEVPGLKIAAVAGTRPFRLAKSNFPNAKVMGYPSLAKASAGLVAGEVDALVHDAPYIRAWTTLNPGQSARFSALLKPVTEEPISIAIRKGDLEFLRFLDTYVREVRQDGTIDRLYKRHFVDARWAESAVKTGGQQ